MDKIHSLNNQLTMKTNTDILKKLISATESMDSIEKQNWLNLLPSMTEDQIHRLFDILETERKKLEELEIRYQ